MALTLNLYNPTPWGREQHVIFGTREKTPYTFKDLPLSYLNVAKVAVPSNFHGDIELDPNNVVEPFKYHPAVVSAFGRGMYPFIRANGQKGTFVIKRFFVNDDKIQIALWRTRVNNAIGELITYTYPNSRIVKYELKVFCESLEYKGLPLKVEFGLDGEGARSVYNIMRFRNAPLVFDSSYIKDSQGTRQFGSFIMFDGVKVEELSTLFAEIEYPLYGIANWTQSWGVCEIPTWGVDKQIAEQLMIDRRKHNYSDPFGWFGTISYKEPGATGAQPSFGVWAHYDTVDTRNSVNALPDQLAVCQESCRPGHYFDTNLEIEEIKNYIPFLIMWDGTIHWHKGVSLERLGRKDLDWPNGPSGNDHDWLGYDRQHFNCTPLAEDFILFGNFGSYTELLHRAQAIIGVETVPSLYGNVSTNGKGAARGMGRISLGAAQIALATGQTEVLDRMKIKLNEVYYPNWTGKDYTVVRPERIICGDNRVFGGRYCGWAVWEDALYCNGLYILAKAFDHFGYHDEAEKCREIFKGVAESIIKFGWRADNQIAKLIKWTGIDEDPLPLDKHNDPDIVEWADQTDFKFWALPMLMGYCKLFDDGNSNPLVSKAAALVVDLLPQAKQYSMRFNFTGIG